MSFVTATLSRVGGREINEDCCASLVLKKAACWVLADGLGGHKSGETASQLAVEAVLNSFRANPALSPRALHRHILAAQNAILARREDQQELSSMRTTLVVLLSDHKSVLWGHIGDSRLYYLVAGRVIFQTKDHSVPQGLVSSGQLSTDQIRHHPDRNRLLRTLGGESDSRPEIIYERHKLHRGDTFLLCTDGFWEYVTESEMEVDLTKVKTPQEWLAKMEARLADRAPEVNDNYSGIAVFFDSPNAPEPGLTPPIFRTGRPKPLGTKLLVPVAVATAVLIGLVALFFLVLKPKFLHKRSSAGTASNLTTNSPTQPSQVPRGKAFSVRLRKPYDTIQQACNEAQEGDAIWLGPGRHNEAFNVMKKLHLKGAGSDEKMGGQNTYTEIDLPKGASIRLGGDRAELEGVRIKAADSEQVLIIGPTIKASLHNNYLQGGSHCVIMLESPVSPAVDISDNTLEGAGACICGQPKEWTDVEKRKNKAVGCQEPARGVAKPVSAPTKSVTRANSRASPSHKKTLGASHGTARGKKTLR